MCHISANNIDRKLIIVSMSMFSRSRNRNMAIIIIVPAIVCQYGCRMANDAHILVMMACVNSDSNGMSRLVGPVLGADHDGIIGFNVFPTMEVLRWLREVPSHCVSSNRVGAFLLQDSAGSPASITPACEYQYPNRDCQRGARSLSSLVG